MTISHSNKTAPQVSMNYTSQPSEAIESSSTNSSYATNQNDLKQKMMATPVVGGGEAAEFLKDLKKSGRFMSTDIASLSRSELRTRKNRPKIGRGKRSESSSSLLREAKAVLTKEQLKTNSPIQAVSSSPASPVAWWKKSLCHYLNLSSVTWLGCQPIEHVGRTNQPIKSHQESSSQQDIKPHRVKRLVNGLSTTNDRMKAAVGKISLPGAQGTQTCTMVVLNDRQVLTSEHCTKRPAEPWAYKVSSGKSTLIPSDIITHPKKDLALVNLATPIPDVSCIPLMAESDASRFNGVSETPFLVIARGRQFTDAEGTSGPLRGGYFNLTTRNNELKEIEPGVTVALGDSGGLISAKNANDSAYSMIGILAGSTELGRGRRTVRWVNVASGPVRQWLNPQLIKSCNPLQAVNPAMYFPKTSSPEYFIQIWHGAWFTGKYFAVTSNNRGANSQWHYWVDWSQDYLHIPQGSKDISIGMYDTNYNVVMDLKFPPDNTVLNCKDNTCFTTLTVDGTYHRINPIFKPLEAQPELSDPSRCSPITVNNNIYDISSRCLYPVRHEALKQDIPHVILAPCTGLEHECSLDDACNVVDDWAPPKQYLKEPTLVFQSTMCSRE